MNLSLTQTIGQRVGGGVGVVAIHVILQRDLGREPVVVDELLHDALLRVPVLVDEDDLAPVPVAVVAARAGDAPALDRVGARVAVGRVRVVRDGQLDALGAQGEAGAVHAEGVDDALLQVRLGHVLAVAQEGALREHFQDARGRVVDGRVEDLFEACRELGLVAGDYVAHLAGDVGPGDEFVVDPLRQPARPRRDGSREGHEADDGGHGLVEVLHGGDVVRGRDAEVRDDARQGQADDARGEGDGRVDRVHVAVPVLDRDQAVPRRQLDGQARLAGVAEVVEAAGESGWTGTSYQKKLGAPNDCARAWTLFDWAAVTLALAQAARNLSRSSFVQVSADRVSAGHEVAPLASGDMEPFFPTPGAAEEEAAAAAIWGMTGVAVTWCRADIAARRVVERMLG
ncbi:hypothetical protein PG993_014882 [Apiospora rasikravindrae]|uniref:Uncharacterized protein n=1 Tax=Apiospora rasikravindrae TaxID=990691 RepID=A0ABR1RP11_9PEZI